MTLGVGYPTFSNENRRGFYYVKTLTHYKLPLGGDEVSTTISTSVTISTLVTIFSYISHTWSVPYFYNIDKKSLVIIIALVICNCYNYFLIIIQFNDFIPSYHKYLPLPFFTVHFCSCWFGFVLDRCDFSPIYSSILISTPALFTDTGVNIEDN